MNAKITARITAALLFAASAVAFADHDYRVARSGGAVYDYAKVISSEPIIDYVTVKRPVRECWEEMQYYTVDHGARHARGGALVGAVIGGVIGHQFGSGSGNDAATAAGTIIGAAIGSENARKRYGVEFVALRSRIVIHLGDRESRERPASDQRRLLPGRLPRR